MKSGKSENAFTGSSCKERHEETRVVFLGLALGLPWGEGFLVSTMHLEEKKRTREKRAEGGQKETLLLESFQCLLYEPPQHVKVSHFELSHSEL